MSPSADDASETKLTNGGAKGDSRTESRSSQDPHEILRASIEYKSNHVSSSIRSSTSSASLYPSLECVKRVADDSDFDSQIDWNNTDVSDRKHAAHNDCRQASVSAVEQSPNNSETEANVTILDCGTIHPLEAESVVQAELVNHFENGHGRERCHLEMTTEPPLDVTGNSSNDEIATEATVIASGPEEKATRAAWAGDSTEAVVLPTESHMNSLENAIESDKKSLPLQNDDLVIVETIPEELSAQAELVGNSSTNNLTPSNARDVSFEHVAVANEGETPTEATVLDCGPLDKATIPAWSTPEEAQVLPNDSLEVEDKKLLHYTDASIQGTSTSNNHQGETTGNNNQAEIVKISEEFHPAELEIENATTAELVGNQNSIFSDSGRIHEEDAKADVILVKEEPNQTPLIQAIPSEVPDSQPFSPTRTFTSELDVCVLPRILLPSSVSYSEDTKSWRATLSTVQKSEGIENTQQVSEGIRAFDVPTEKQAICLARAWTPPMMQPFSDDPKCFVCKLKLKFHEARNCKNCGVCICFFCTAQWPSKMVPATYNSKDDATINVCKTCDWLCSEFRLALLNGDRDKALALYHKGNINLTRPFANIKGEVFYPVHCAVLGKSLWLLKWLVEDNCCPMKSSGERGARKDGYNPILTSKSRSLLNIALSNNSVHIMKYLVVEKNMPLQEEKNMPTETLLQAIDSILRAP